MPGRFQIVFDGRPYGQSRSLWFDTREDAEASLRLFLGCPVDDGPVRARIVEYVDASGLRVDNVGKWAEPPLRTAPAEANTAPTAWSKILDDGPLDD